MGRSLAGRSIAVQSGIWRIDLLAITRDGKFTVGSTSMTSELIAEPESGYAPATGVNVWPPVLRTITESQLSSRCAVCTIASNTGWTSVGEPEITRRISAVAV